MAEPITNVLGIVGMENKGAYDADAYYEKLNVVSYQGSSYCALDSVHNVLPTDTTKWQLIAEKGDKGDTGEEGYTPIKGTDYYTAEDKAELESTLSDDVTSEVTEQLEDLVSATPLAASSVAGMTDTTRIYVNTTDGHWYWYDGDSWEDGGTYQATGISEGSITYKELDDNLDQLFIKNVDYIDFRTEGVKTENYRMRYYNSVFEAVSDSYYDYYKLTLDDYVGKTILFSVAYYYLYPAFFITDSGDNVLYSTDVTSSYNLIPQNIVLNITPDMKYLYINTNKGATSNALFYNIGVIKDFKNAINYNGISELNPIQNISGWYISDPNTPTSDAYKKPYYSALSGTSVKQYRLNKGEKYKITGKNWAQSDAFVLTNDKYEVKLKSTALYETDESFNYEFTSEYDGYIITTYHATNSPTQIFIYDRLESADIATDSSLGVVKVGNTLEISNDGTLNVKDNTGYMSNLKIGFTGDSICAQGGGYATVLHNLYGLNIQNIAVGGGHLANDDPNAFCISNSISNLANDCDAIIVEGGINDHANSVPLGELSANYTAALNQGTLYGALEKICRDLYTYHHGKYFAFLIVHNVNNRYFDKIGGNSFEDYRNAMYAVCKKYGIPIIDIGANGSMNTYDTDMKETYTLPYQGHGDGLHPNTAGYTKFYVPLIKDWIDKTFSI